MKTVTFDESAWVPTRRRVGVETATYLCANSACGKPFEARTAERERGWARFCSKACAAMEHGNNRGGKRTKEYRTWAHILGRCNNPSDANYCYYGARGIRVAPEWADSFEAFLRDVGRAPSPRHSIDRINNDGNYEPGNVRWATSAEQNRNTRKNVFVNGMCLVDACAALGISYGAAQARIRKGQTPEQAIAALKEKL